MNSAIVLNNILQKSEEFKSQFPVDAFPDRIQQIIRHYVDIKGYPDSYLGVGILTALGISIGNSHILNTINGYQAKGNLFAVIIGRRGFNKSEALDDSFKPIEAFTNNLYKKYKHEMEEFMMLSKKDREDRTPPFFGKPILDDVTTEAAAQQLSYYPKGCGIIVDELAGFLKSFDQYRKSGGDEQFYLSAWSNKSITIDRATKGPIRIMKPFLSIIGTIQPEVADQVFYGKEESGFLDRWLICYPERLTKPYPSQRGVDPVISGTYDTILNSLLKYKVDIDDINPIELSYTPESWDIVYDYICKSTDIENNPDTTATEGGIRSKMDIYIHRFCLILQLAKFACGETSTKDIIEPHTALNAVKLANYFYSQADKKRIKERSELLSKGWKEVFDMLHYGFIFGVKSQYF
ncbi:MAG: DUF3987 domain-containing protein [Nitrososphaeria archaeon]